LTLTAAGGILARAMYMRRRSPISRIVAVLVLVGGLALAGIKIKGAVHDSNVVDSQARRLSQLAEGGLGSSYLIQRNFAAALVSVRGKIGARAPMLEVDVNTTSVEFQYVVGQRAAGWQANSVQPTLVPEQVTLDSSASPRSRSFPLTLVRASTPSRLIREIKRRPGLSDFSVDAETLSRSPVDNHLGWTVVGSGGGHDVVFHARPDGTHLAQIPS
jgi:hypothetical protein